MSVDAEATKGTVTFLVLGDGELPSLETLEASARGVLCGRNIRVKVVQSRTLDLDLQ